MTTESTRLPWSRLLLLATAAFWAVLLEMLPTGLLPAMTSDLHVSPSRVGLLVSVWAATVAVTTMPLIRLSRALDRRTLLALALGVVGLTTVLSAASPGYAGVAVGRVVAAAAHGVAWSALLVVAAALAPRREGRAVSIVMAGPTLATAVGLPLGTALSDLAGWRVVLAAVGAALIVVAVVVRTSVAAIPSAPTGPRGERDASVRPTVALALVGSFALTGHFVAFTFIAPLATDRWGFDDAGIAPLLLAFGVSGAAGLAVAAWLGDQAPRATLLGSVGALAAILALAPTVSSAAGAVPLMIAWGAVIGLLPPTLQGTVLAAASPAFRDTAGAVMVTAFNLGVAGGALVGGVLLHELGLGAVLPVGAACALLSVTGLAVIGLRSRAVPRRRPALPSWARSPSRSRCPSC